MVPFPVRLAVSVLSLEREAWNLPGADPSWFWPWYMVMECLKSVFACSHSSGVMVNCVLVLLWSQGKDGWMMVLSCLGDRAVVEGFFLGVVA